MEKVGNQDRRNQKIRWIILSLSCLSSVTLIIKISLVYIIV